MKFDLSYVDEPNGASGPIAFDWHLFGASVGKVETSPTTMDGLFVCTALGNQTVELTITGGDPAGVCSSSARVTIDCTSLCGNGIVDPGETCDPPNGGSCNATCNLVNPDGGAGGAGGGPGGASGGGGGAGTGGGGGGGAGTGGAAGSPFSCASSPGKLLDIGTLPGDTDSAGVGIDDTGDVVATSTSATTSGSFFWRDGTKIPLVGNFGLARAIAMNRNGRTVGAVGGSCNGHSCFAAWDAPSPSPTMFGVASPLQTVVSFVGDNGAPFGSVQVQPGDIRTVHAVTWPPVLGTAFIDLGTIDGVSTTGSLALAANSLGHAVGTSGGRAVIWDPSIRDLGNLGAGGASGVDINDAGDVAGTSATAGGSTHAFLWRAGVMQDLGTLLGGSSQAIAINAAGDVAGNSDGHAVLWTAGTMIDLGPLGDSGTVVAISDGGLVTGNSVFPPGGSHAFLWQGGVMTDLGTLGGTFSSATGINASGRVVGTSKTASGNSHAFVACPADSSTGNP